MIEEDLLKAVLARQRALEEAVFSNPPSTYDQFKERLGRWIELNETKAWVAEVLRQADIDEDD